FDIINILSIISVMVILLYFTYTLISMHNWPILEKTNIPQFIGSPLVSIIIPANNEFRNLQLSISSILNQSYTNFELVVILDRCIDRSNEFLNGLKDRRLRCIEVKKLPGDWLGKVYALNKGLDIANGEYSVFTDSGDVWSKDLLSKAVGVSISQNLSHLTILPHIVPQGFFQQIINSTFMLTLIQFWNLKIKKHRKLKLYRGFGAFNMVKTDDFRQTKGFEALKMEILDDFGIAKLMQDKQFKSNWYITKNEISRVWYDSLKHALIGSSKSLYYLLCDYQPLRFVLLLTFMGIVLFFPIINLINGHLSGGLLFASVFVIQTIVAIQLIKKVNLSWTLILLYPLGIFLYKVCLIHSFIGFYVNKGVAWRGTLYHKDNLVKNRYL
ncbi:MAG: glycosyltransferase family 2 protein, partial [Bacteroidales bacterium]|nr:glycosyltransferase family 2 protein [Bacteroidales bacterium]